MDTFLITLFWFIYFTLVWNGLFYFGKQIYLTIKFHNRRKNILNMLEKQGIKILRVEGENIYCEPPKSI